MRTHQTLRLGLLREIEDAAGQCRQPVRVRGRLTECDPVTGEVIRIVDTSELPGGRIEVPCGNRREQVCPPCSRLYKGDTFQVTAAGRRYEAGKAAPTVHILRSLAIALNVSADALLFDPGERGPEDDLALRLEAISRLDPDEKAAVFALIESMLLRHEARRLTTSPRAAAQ